MTAPGPWHIAVVVPAHDEEATIERCLRSVLRATDALEPGDGRWRAAYGGGATEAHTTTDVVVVADACTDATAQRARRALAGRGVVVTVRSGSVGVARRVGTWLAIVRSPAPPGRTWIAGTDADSTVPRAWLTTQLAAARDGAHAVAGIVRLRAEQRNAGLRRSFADVYHLGDDGTHHHVHGANLGVRADAYVGAGGWSSLACGEDHDLWRRLCALGPTVSTTASYVRTSTRRTGRAPGGFAADLAALDPPTAEPA